MAGSRQTTFEDVYTGQLLAKLAARGERDTIVYGQRRISGREAHDLILRYAGALTDLGVDEGEGVALLTVNSPEALLLTLAVHFLGGRLVFVPPEPGNGEPGSFIEQADVKLLIFDPVLAGRAAQLADETQVVTYSLGPADGAPDFLAAAGPWNELAPEDVAPASSGAAEPRMLVRTLLSHVSGHFAALMALFSGQAVVLMPGEGFDAASSEASPVGSYA